MTVPLATDLVLVSDLHLGAGPRDGFRHDREFVGFTDALRRRADERGRAARLVLLGDFLDFARVAVADQHDGRAGALERLERIGAAHVPVFAALRRLLAGGLGVDVVAGNHDADLVRGDVRAAFADTVGAKANGALRFHPWQLYVPGVVYAEHGHQYHDVNAFSTATRPCGPLGDEAPETTIGAALDGYAHGAGPRRHTALAAALAASGVRVLDPRRRARRAAYRRDVLPSHAATIGLDAATVAALDAESARTVRAMIPRLARKAVRSVIRRPPPCDDYLRPAAARVGTALAAGGAPVPFLVFGHTHSAGRWPLVAGPRPVVLLNTGTWCSRGGRADDRLTYVEVTPDGDGDAPAAAVRCWDGDDA